MHQQSFKNRLVVFRNYLWQQVIDFVTVIFVNKKNSGDNSQMTNDIIFKVN